MAFEDLAKESNETRAAALSALADSGTAGVDAYRQAQTALKAQETSALQAEGSYATGRMEAGEVNRLGALQAAPLQTAQGRAEARQADFTSDIARQSASLSGYLSKVQGAAALAEQQVAADLALARASAGGGGGSGSSKKSDDPYRPNSESGWVNTAYGRATAAREQVASGAQSRIDEYNEKNDDAALRLAAQQRRAEADKARAVVEKQRNNTGSYVPEEMLRPEKGGSGSRSRFVSAGNTASPYQSKPAATSDRLDLSPAQFQAGIDAASRKEQARQTLAATPTPLASASRTNRYNDAAGIFNRLSADYANVTAPQYQTAAQFRGAANGSYVPDDMLRPAPAGLTRPQAPGLALARLEQAAQRAEQAAGRTPRNGAELFAAQQRLAESMTPTELEQAIAQGIIPAEFAGLGTPDWEIALQEGIAMGADPYWLSAVINEQSDLEREQDRLAAANSLTSEELEAADLEARAEFFNQYGYETPQDYNSNMSAEQQMRQQFLLDDVQQTTNIPWQADTLATVGSVLRADDDTAAMLMKEPDFVSAILGIEAEASAGRSQEEVLFMISETPEGQYLASAYSPAVYQVLRVLTGNLFGADMSVDGSLTLNPDSFGN